MLTSIGMKKSIILGLLGIILLSSCSEYQRILKSTDRKEKLDYAMKMYEKKKYSKATAVFEELYTTSVGVGDGELIHYYYAKSYYGAGDYLLASYFFELFLNKYRFSKYEEDAAYSFAMCYYKDSPEDPLDQTNTLNAIAQLQIFVDRYPTSPLVAECNKRIEELRLKLEDKAYRVAMQYYRMEYYQASATAFMLLLKDFPDTKRRNKCSFLIVKSSYLLAINSIKSKKKERLEEVLKNYDKFAPSIKDDKDKKEIDDIKLKATEALNEIIADEAAAKLAADNRKKEDELKREADNKKEKGKKPKTKKNKDNKK